MIIQWGTQRPGLSTSRQIVGPPGPSGEASILPVVKTNGYTVVAADYGDLIRVDATSGAATINLPATATDGSVVRIQKSDATTNAVIVKNAALATVATMIAQYETATLIVSSNVWLPVIDNKASSTIRAETATPIAGTTGTFTGTVQTGSGGALAEIRSDGDIRASRSGGTTGVLYFGSGSTKYLLYGGTEFAFSGGGLSVASVAATGALSGASLAIGAGGITSSSGITISGTAGGTVVNQFIIKNPAAASVGTGVGLQLVPNSASGITRAAGITATQTISGDYADLKLWVANAATPWVAVTLNVDRTATFAASVSITGAVTATTYIKPGLFTFATLPSAAAAGQGARAHISDCNTTTFNAAAAGGSTNSMPVFVDAASAWKVG